MTTKWLSRQGESLQGHIHAANQQQKNLYWGILPVIWRLLNWSINVKLDVYGKDLFLKYIRPDLKKEQPPEAFNLQNFL